jgi:hypothetical protein
LRKKRRNLPRPVGTAHINLIPIHIPLFRLSYWKLESESSLLYTESEYQKLPKADHLDRVTFEPLEQTIRLPMPRREETPTLYTLANIAFPLRWIDRKGPWTRACEHCLSPALDRPQGSVDKGGAGADRAG